MGKASNASDGTGNDVSTGRKFLEAEAIEKGSIDSGAAVAICYDLTNIEDVLLMASRTLAEAFEKQAAEDKELGGAAWGAQFSIARCATELRAIREYIDAAGCRFPNLSDKDKAIASEGIAKSK